jgi:FkbM family methyltransferase
MRRLTAIRLLKSAHAKIREQLYFNERSYYFRFLRITNPRRITQIMSRIVSSREPETDLLPLLCSPDKNSVDVGVLWGGYTWQLRSLSRRCIAIEANPRQAEFLRNVFPEENVTIINAALSDREGEAQLRVPNDTTGHGTIHDSNSLSGRPSHTYTVPMKTLDSLPVEQVDFIKIDVEGHELAVLRGAARILEVQRPALLVELSQALNGHISVDVLKYLHDFGYEAYVFTDAHLVKLPYPPGRLPEPLFPGQPKRASNVLFVAAPLSRSLLALM